MSNHAFTIMNKLILLALCLLLPIFSVGQSKKELTDSIKILNSQIVKEKIKNEYLRSKLEEIKALVDKFNEGFNAVVRDSIPAQIQSSVPHLHDHHSSAALSSNTEQAQCIATTSSGRRCSRTAEKGSLYCWQHKNSSTKVSPQTSSSSSNSKVIHTGPRGGRYYINKNGNKTYVKR